MDKHVHGAMCEEGYTPSGKAKDNTGSDASALPRPRVHNAVGYRVVLDLPDVLPVTEGELELLESELADFIAELLKK